MNRLSHIGMPKACISCVHYRNTGWDKDEHCPFKAPFHLSEAPTRTPYGRCSEHGSEVFATEICNSYEVEPFVIPTEVSNRPVPREPRQERLNLGA